MAHNAKLRIGRLNSVGGVITELGKIYREARRGTLEKPDAERLARILTAIRSALEVGEIEARLNLLENGGSGDWAEPPPFAKDTAADVSSANSGDKTLM